MKLYLLTQYQRRGYSTYDSMVVCAETEEEARKIHPSDYSSWEGNTSWADKPENVKVEYIGEAKEGLKKGKIVASYNAA